MSKPCHEMSPDETDMDQQYWHTLKAAFPKNDGNKVVIKGNTKGNEELRVSYWLNNYVN